MANNKVCNNGNGSRTFIKITNKDIFDKIVALETEVKNYHGCNSREHEEFKGKFKLHFWLFTAAIAVAGYAVVWLWSHVSVA